jgi:cytochrome c oxidase subunit IV
MWHKIWGVLLLLAGISWLVDTGRIINGYQPDKFSMVIAFLITGLATINWAVEAYNEE